MNAEDDSRRFDVTAKSDFRIESYVMKCKFDYSIMKVQKITTVKISKGIKAILYMYAMKEQK